MTESRGARSYNQSHALRGAGILGESNHLRGSRGEVLACLASKLRALQNKPSASELLEKQHPQERAKTHLQLEMK